MNGSLLSLIENGGITMYPLLVCSVVSLAVVLERLWVVVTSSRAATHLHDLVLGAIGQGSRSEALAMTRIDGSMLSRVYTVVLADTADDTRDRLVRHQQNEAARQLRRHVWLLGTIGSLAPFIGLFGTVVGIIRAFESMAATGAGGFAVVAAGISEALIATAGGLAVGVLSIFAYNALLVRINDVVATWRGWTDEVIALLNDARPRGARIADVTQRR